MSRTLRPPNRWQKICRHLLLRVLDGLTEGRIVIRDAEGCRAVGPASAPADFTVEIEVWDPSFYPAVLLKQSAGTGRAYMEGWWGCEDPVTLMRILARNEKVLRRWTAPTLGLLAPVHRAALWTRRNTVAGAKKNIATHYDLGEDFFAAFLDPSLTYSSAFFTAEAADLESAQREKLDRACRKLALGPEDHVLEIGTGWGSFAIHAVRNYGCRVTTTTISAEQARYAAERVKELGLDDRITVLQQDYRNLTGQYDKLVSLEMIEAVGVRYYPAYFGSCSKLLKDDGAMLLQAIVVDDRHFDHDAKHIDFIKQYIFPGGVLPSISVIAGTVGAVTDLQIGHLEDMTAHYARTLRIWRERLRAAWSELVGRGKDVSFLRCWDFYFAYCEGGFRERRIGNVQMLLVKPQSAVLRNLPRAADSRVFKQKEGRAS